MQIKLDSRERYFVILFSRKEFSLALKVLSIIKGIDNDSVNRLVALSCRLSEIIDKDSVAEQLGKTNLTLIKGGKTDD